MGSKGRRLTILAAGVLSLVPAPALANTYRPNKLGDHAPNGCTADDCTAREAIIKANNHAGADTVVLKSGKTYQLSLPVTADDATDGDLDVEGTLKVVASDRQQATVDANDVDRVFDLNASTTFNRVTIRGGNSVGSGSGGGIRNSDGTLRLSRSRVTGNQGQNGGGIDLDGGTLRMVRSVVSGNEANGIGGGLTSAPIQPATIKKSTITGNTSDFDGDGAGDGGGIYNAGVLTITASTIANNSAPAIPGGGQNGGGILNDADGDLTMVNDTVFGNSVANSGGGIANYSGGTVSLNAVTVANNTSDSNDGSIGEGGGLNNGGIAEEFSVENSLIANNSSGGGGAFGPDCYGTFASGGHNLIGNDDGCSGFTGTGDLFDLDPMLGTLDDNGGPTKTVRLKAGSPAIGNAGPDAPPRDQRGVGRDAHPDSGAYER